MIQYKITAWMWSHYNGLPSGYCTSSLGFLRTFKGNGPGIGLHQFKVFPFCCSKDDWVWFKWGSWKMFLAFLSISTPKSRRQYSLTIKEVLHWGSFQACEIWSYAFETVPEESLCRHFTSNTFSLLWKTTKQWCLMQTWWFCMRHLNKLFLAKTVRRLEQIPNFVT